MKENQVLYTIQNRQCIIKMLGEIRYTISAGLNAVIDHAFGNTKIETFIIDLTETTYIDSTNLGILAKIAKWTREKGVAKSTIFSSSGDVNMVLDSMGFGDLFYLIEGSLQDFDDFCSVNLGTENKKERGKLMLEAHIALMEMNESNRETFRSAVELLEREIQSI